MIKAEEIIREVALRHGVALSKDDPVMILHTLNEMLLLDNKKTIDGCQERQLRFLKEEMNKASKLWTEEAKSRAQQVLDLAVETSREAVITETKAELEPLATVVKKEMEVIEAYGGEILFTPGDVVFSSSHIIETEATISEALSEAWNIFSMDASGRYSS